MQETYLNIAIPSNILEDCNNLRSKTQKLGQIARAAAIFRVQKIIIYSIDKTTMENYSQDIKLIKGILEYLDCPQYLRKSLIPKLPMFKYVGTLPPLRTPHHPLEKEFGEIARNSIREGFVLFSNQYYSNIEIGLEKPLKIKIPNLPKNTRIILKLKKQQNILSGVPIKKENIKEYWGFDVEIFEESLKLFRKKFSNYIIVATSKRGIPIKQINNGLVKKFGERNKIIILFGSPNKGLFEIFENNGINLAEWVDLVINSIPKQGTHTIRVEEAIFSTLAVLNYILTQ